MEINVFMVSSRSVRAFYATPVWLALYKLDRCLNVTRALLFKEYFYFSALKPLFQRVEPFSLRLSGIFDGFY